MQEKQPSAAPLFVIIGLAIILTAVLAEKLGIDPSAGWGRGRIALFAFGTLVTILSLLAWYPSRWTRPVEERITLVMDRIPGLRHLQHLAWYGRLLDTLRNYWPAVPLTALIILLYASLVTSGTWIRWKSATQYYAELARGFQQGHLYLNTKVDRRLLTAPDPYEPYPWGGPPLDYSYYNRRYYMPWGAVPGLIVLGTWGLSHRWLGDLHLTFGFASGSLLALCLMLLILWQRHFRGLPRWMLWMALPLIGLAGPIPFMLGNRFAARIYEAAVTGGQFFLVCGTLFALLALERILPECALAIAGALWALAVGSRIDLVLPIGVMVLLVSVWIVQTNGMSARSLKALAALYVPLVLGGAVIGWYNWARFGSVTETGYYYALAGDNVHKHWNERFSPAYILPNLYAYLVNPVSLKLKFPFVSALAAKFTPKPSFYFTQPTIGMVWLAPFVLFAFIPLAQFLKSRFSKTSVESGCPEGARFLGWFQVTLAAASLTTFMFLMMLFWAAMRYVEDFLPSLLLVGILGFWQGYAWLSENKPWARAYAALAIFLAAASILVSLLAAVPVNVVRLGLLPVLSGGGY